MAEKLMFSDIKEFKNEDFFNTHKTGKLYTDSGIYNIRIYTVNVLDSNKDIAYRIEQYKKGKNTELIKSFENSAIYKNEVEVSDTDKFIMLTTCNGVGTPERAVLFCKLEKVESTSSINEENNSDINRDEKVKEKEEFEKQKEIESKRILSELSKEEYKNKKNTEKNEKLEKIEYYWKQLLNDPKRLILYILVFITIIIYLVVIVKRIKNKNRNKKRSCNENKIEQRNQRRITELKNANKLIDIKDNNAQNKVNYNNSNHNLIKTKKKKGKHSK